MSLVLMIIGVVIGSFICYFVLKPKITVINSINEDIKKQNDELQGKNQDLAITNIELSNCYQELTEQIGKLNIIKAQVETERDQIKNSIELLQEQANKSNEVIYQQSYNLMQEELTKSAEKLSNKYQQYEQNYQNEYLQTLDEAAQELAAALASKLEQIGIVEEQLAQLRAKADAAIAAARREEEKALELDKYKILISEADLLEINRLREIAPYFRNSRVLYKMIWEGYYRTPTNELLGRILKTDNTVGVYKITNLKNQRIYIGQSVNLNTRLVDHIKAGLGIDTPNNVLYTAMMADGVENFSFEILETCGRNQLNDRETFYIDFYQSQIHGYNMTKGGSKK